MQLEKRPQQAFAQRGALLVLFARSEAPLRKLAEEIDDSCCCSR